MRFKFYISFFILLLSSTVSYSQLCIGSLGDAVVNIQFGSGIGIGAPLSASTTTYSYVASDCPPDGSYTIINKTNNCFGNTWHNINEDHTPNDINGYMMLVNASLTPKDFYLDTVTNLCPNTTYAFSAWIINVLKSNSCAPSPTRPKLVFTIETVTGTILGSYSTGDILETPSPEWKQYGLFFTTPNSTSTVVIRITNNAPGGCGNDIALDDITFQPCGPKVSTSVLNTSQTNYSICVGNTTPVTLAGTVGNGYLNPSLQWQLSTDNGITWANITGATIATFNFTNTTVGIYQYRLLVAEAGNINNINCRIASNITTITISDLPVITATSNSPVCEGTTISLNANGGNTYNWVGPNGFSSTLQNPVLTAGTNTSGTYSVKGFNTFNCSSTSNTNVIILPKPIVSVTPKDPSVCITDSVLLIAGGGINYSWLPATGLNTNTGAIIFAKPTITTTYTVIVTAANTCVDSATVKVEVLQRPVVNAGVDKVLIKGQKAVLNGFTDTNNVNYFWTPPDFLNSPNILNPITFTPVNREYILHVVSTKGCGTTRDSVLVKVFNDLYIPNAFTPNGDGKNDTWRVEALAAYPLARTFIYNRYGELVFQSNSPFDYWNGKYKGKAAIPGGYIYWIDLKNNTPIIKGTVFVLR